MNIKSIRLPAALLISILLPQAAASEPAPPTAAPAMTHQSPLLSPPSQTAAPLTAGSPQGIASSAAQSAMLKGEAVSYGVSWERFYMAARQALERRMYDLAEKRLLAAQKEVRRAAFAGPMVVRTSIALADVYVATDRCDSAEHLYARSLSSARKLFGTLSDESASCLIGLARANCALGRFREAESQSREALSIRKRLLGQDHHNVGEALAVLGKILARQGWDDQAESAFKEALRILERHSGYQNLDLADLLRDMGICYLEAGKRAESKAFFDRSTAIRETAASFDQSATVKGLVRFPWDAGSPSAREIPDEKYPFRYMYANGLRVGAALVHIGRASGAKVYGALISIGNASDNRLEVGVGPVSLFSTSPSARQIPVLEPNKIDRIYWERAVWDLTWKQPVLANLQRTRTALRRLRGEPPDLPDDYGGNVFGTYAHWSPGPMSLPDIVAREHMHARGEALLQTGVALSTPIAAMDLNPVAMGPWDSRTGIVFFKNDPFQRAVLKVLVGNSSFEFPFQFPEPW